MVGKQRRTVKKLHKRRNILKGYSKKKPHYIQKKSRRKKTSYKRKRPNKRTRGKRRKFILSGGGPDEEEAAALRDVDAFLWSARGQYQVNPSHTDEEVWEAKQMAKDLALLRAGKKGLLSPQEASEYNILTTKYAQQLSGEGARPEFVPLMRRLLAESKARAAAGRAEIVQQQRRQREQLSQDQGHGKEET